MPNLHGWETGRVPRWRQWASIPERYRSGRPVPAAARSRGASLLSTAASHGMPSHAMIHECLCTPHKRRHASSTFMCCEIAYSLPVSPRSPNRDTVCHRSATKAIGLRLSQNPIGTGCGRLWAPAPLLPCLGDAASGHGLLACASRRLFRAWPARAQAGPVCGRCFAGHCRHGGPCSRRGRLPWRRGCRGAS